MFLCSAGSACLLKSVPNRKKLPTGYVSLFGRFGLLVEKCTKPEKIAHRICFSVRPVRPACWKVYQTGKNCPQDMFLCSAGSGVWLSERKVSDSRGPRFFSFLFFGSFFLFFSPKKRKEKKEHHLWFCVCTVRETFLDQISMFFTPFSRVCPDLLGLWLRSRFWCLCWFGFFRCCGFYDSLHCGWRAADQRCDFADTFPVVM